MCKSISMHEIVNLNLFSIIQSQKKKIRTRHPSSVGQLSDKCEFRVGQMSDIEKMRRMFRIDPCHVLILAHTEFQWYNCFHMSVKGCSRTIYYLHSSYVFRVCTNCSVILHILQFSLLAILSTNKTMSSSLTFLLPVFHFGLAISSWV